MEVSRCAAGQRHLRLEMGVTDMDVQIPETTCD